MEAWKAPVYRSTNGYMILVQKWASSKSMAADRREEVTGERCKEKEKKRERGRENYRKSASEN